MITPSPDRPGSKARLILAAICLVAATAAAGVYAYTQNESNAPAIELAPALMTMRDTPKAFLATERDGSTLLAALSEGNVAAVAFKGERALVLGVNDERYYVNNSRGYLTDSVINAAKQAQGAPAVAFLDDASGNKRWDTILRTSVNLLMFLLYGTLIYIGLRVYRDFKTGHAPLSEAPTVRFSDVIGVEEAKASLQDVVQYLREPQHYARLGARAPAGVLLLGGPGVGKTLLAKALAGECGAKFISANGSDFTSKYVGVGVQKVKALFETARKNAPCIVFIDEIDGIAKRTSASGSAAESENNRIINQVLVEMDGFDKNEGVVVIGATNLAENLDEAMLREGRFDRQVQVKLPDMIDRARVLEHYAKSIKLDPAEVIDFTQLARLTTGFSPATLAYVMNHAAIVAARKQEEVVRTTHLLEAIETAHMGELNGAQRALTEEERRRIAAHEAGHAIVAAATNCGVVEKVTILPRGGALGVTLVTHHQDKMLHLRSDMEKRIMMLLGGRNAELAVFNEASSGAAHDLQECTRIALAMVGKFGFGEGGSLVNLDGLPANHAGSYVKESIEQAKQLLHEMNVACQALLSQHERALMALTQELIEHETVTGARVQELLSGA